MSTRCFHVDAFANGPFTGNPAAVCILDAAKSAADMQAFAAEMNLAETAFVSRASDGWDLRWFTPKCEVDLCGHATLASAHVLVTECAVPPETLIEFHTKSGRLTARHVGDKIELDFPSRPAVPTELPSGLTAALSAEHTAVLRNEMDLLLEFADEQVLKSLEPDFPALDKIPGIRGVIVTSASQDPEYDFISRFFAPAVGINEDPVTGSAHCALAPYWAAKLGRATLTGYQASGRGGVVETEIRGDRVLLRGSAVTILRSELAVDLM